MQNVHSDTYMHPLKEDLEHPVILNINMISSQESIISDYFEYPELIPNGSFTGRIQVHTNHPLTDYKSDAKFTKYLAQEKIILEEIRLTDVDPPNLGFLEELVPDYETLRLHTIRIRKYLPSGHPMFQLFVKTLYDSRRRSTRVVMVKCNGKDIEELQSMFINLHKAKTIKFCSWKEFTSLNDVLFDMAVQKQYQFNKYFRNVPMSGFKDNEDNIPIHYNRNQSNTSSVTEDETADPLEQILVSDYIGSMAAGNGTLLFDHIYEPIKGVRDSIVHVDNYSEAKAYAAVVLVELARVMNDISKNLVIANLSEVETAVVNKPSWQPYTKAAELIMERQTMASQPQKRARTDSGEQKTSRRGNLKSPPTKNTPTPTQNPTPSPVWNTTSNNTVNPTWEQITNHMQQKIDENNSVLRQEIQETNVAQQKRLATMDRSIGNYSTTLTAQYELLTELGNQNKDAMTNRFNRLETMFANLMSNNLSTTIQLDTTFQHDSTNQHDMLEDIQDLNQTNIMDVTIADTQNIEQSMDCSFHRDELALKRQLLKGHFDNTNEENESDDSFSTSKPNDNYAGDIGKKREKL
jgi:hypothetical protein